MYFFRRHIKGYYNSPKLLKYLQHMNDLEKSQTPEDPKTIINQFRTRNRSNTINIEMVGRTFYVYDGKKFKDFIIEKEMLGDKLGEYCFTRQIAKEKKKKKTKKKRFKK